MVNSLGEKSMEEHCASGRQDEEVLFSTLFCLPPKAKPRPWDDEKELPDDVTNLELPKLT